MLPDRIISPSDFRRRARARLPRVLFDYVDGGSYEEVTLKRNREDLERLRLRQRIMHDMSSVVLDTEIFGISLDMPVILGPVGFAGMLWRRGEVAAARAAHDAGIAFALSTVGICPFDEVAQAVAPPWMQLYMIKDRSFMREMLRRIWSQGSPVLVLTLDLQTPAARYRDARSGMAASQGLRGRARQAWDGLSHPSWLWDVYLRGRPHSFGNLAGATGEISSFAQSWAWIGQNFDPSVTWNDLEFVREVWPGPIIAKGILDVEDARAAVDHGVDGIVVSNHGGRQLDGVRSSISALEPIVDAVGGDVPVFVDGGISSGLDVIKALASGARACFLGRAWAFALAAGGQAGVARALARMKEELRVAMVLTGCADVKKASRDLLDQADGRW